MTDVLASIAGLPTSVCRTAKQLSDSIDFDPVDRLSPRTRTLEAYALVAERLVWCARWWPSGLSSAAEPPLP